MPITAGEQRTPPVKRLFYAFFGVALLAALTFMWREESGEDGTPFAMVFAFFLGLSVISLAVGGVRSGRVRVRHREAPREENPIAFWAAVGILFVIGVTMAAAGVLMFFGTV